MHICLVTNTPKYFLTFYSYLDTQKLYNNQEFSVHLTYLFITLYLLVTKIFVPDRNKDGQTT